MSTHRIHIFVSHSWTYSSHYETLYDWIYSRGWRYGQASLRFSDYSVPKDDPIHDAPTARVLMDAILRKIVRSHVVVIPTGMYATYSKWISGNVKYTLHNDNHDSHCREYRQVRKAKRTALSSHWAMEGSRTKD